MTARMTAPTGLTAGEGEVSPTSPDHQTHILNRSTEMLLMHEEMARAHTAQLLEEAVRRRRAQRLVAAHRAARRAEKATLRARRLLALAVTQ